MQSPTISIITINYNGGLYLEKTITSIIEQSHSNIEYIVIDGDSSDESCEIINRHSKRITKYISEPDHGIADAMNKGLKLSTGDLILFLHSDDYLIDNSSIDDALSEIDSINEIFAYPIRYGNNNKSQILKPRGFNKWMYFKTGIYHQAAICRKEVFQRIGEFDTNFSITMDYDFFIRAYKSECKLKICNKEFSFMRNSGVSSQTDQDSLNNRFIEEKRVHLKNSHSNIAKLTYKTYWPLYMLYRQIRHSLTQITIN